MLERVEKLEEFEARQMEFNASVAESLAKLTGIVTEDHRILQSVVEIQKKDGEILQSILDIQKTQGETLGKIISQVERLETGQDELRSEMASLRSEMSEMTSLLRGVIHKLEVIELDVAIIKGMFGQESEEGA